MKKKSSSDDWSALLSSRSERICFSESFIQPRLSLLFSHELMDVLLAHDLRLRNFLDFLSHFELVEDVLELLVGFLSSCTAGFSILI